MKGGGLFGFLLKALGFGFLAVILGITTAAIVIHIKGIITHQKLKEELQKKNMKGAIVTLIDRTKNQVSLKDLDGGKILEIHGDGISDDLHKRERIYV